MDLNNLLDNDFWEDINDVDEVDAISNRQPDKSRIRINPFKFYTDEDFRSKYRFTKAFARNIVELIKNDLTPETRRGSISPETRGGSFSPEIQVACALRSWARHEVQDDTADLHGVSQQVVSKICKNVAIALACKAPNYIKMMDTIDEEQEMVHKFKSISNFPQVIGAIDCTHIKIKKVGGELSQYYVNRKGYYSVNVQVVCDADLRIRDIVARWRGSTHDSRIFNESRIKERFENGQFHGRLLGDGGYACTSYLFTPLLTTNNAKEEQYNFAHIRTRNVVERCFGVWKQRFRCLLRGMTVKYENVKTTIIALAVLHNMALDMKEPSTETFTPTESALLEPRATPQSSIRGNIARRIFIEENF